MDRGTILVTVFLLTMPIACRRGSHEGAEERQSKVGKGFDWTGLKGRLRTVPGVLRDWGTKNDVAIPVRWSGGSFGIHGRVKPGGKLGAAGFALGLWYRGQDEQSVQCVYALFDDRTEGNNGLYPIIVGTCSAGRALGAIDSSESRKGWWRHTVYDVFLAFEPAGVAGEKPGLHFRMEYAKPDVPGAFNLAFTEGEDPVFEAALDLPDEIPIPRGDIPAWIGLPGCTGAKKDPAIEFEVQELRVAGLKL